MLAIGVLLPADVGASAFRSIARREGTPRSKGNPRSTTFDHISTKVVTGIEVSGWTAHDTSYFVPLVEITAAHFDVERVSADKAYLSHKNAGAVEAVGATPFVPFKSNSLPPAEDSAWSRMYHYFMFNREEFLRHYHRRSSAESVFSMVKAKFGDSIRAKSDNGQVNEALCKILCHNVCVLIHATHSLGVEPSFTPNNVAHLPAR